MRGSESLGLFDEGSLVAFSQFLPLFAENFGDFRIMHFGIVLRDFAALSATPDHEGVHRTTDARRIVDGRFGLLGIAR